jgi:hypothetical protein
MSAPVRIGIAGLGRMGRRHAENLARRVPGAALAAACSPVADDLEWAQRELGGVRAYTNYAQMLTQADLDAVFLVTPTTLHAQQIVDAVRRALEITPPELAADIVDRGIIMTGGGALIRGLDLLLQQETGLPIHLDEDPLTCVVRGTGRILDDMEKYRSVLTS